MKIDSHLHVWADLDQADQFPFVRCPLNPLRVEFVLYSLDTLHWRWTDSLGDTAWRGAAICWECQTANQINGGGFSLSLLPVAGC
jgi:hypothetical protein